MRLSDFCNRPTTRAPCTLPDSRLRSPSRRSVLRPRDVPAHADPPSTARSGLRLLQHPDGEPSGGASLDGEPPASASLQPSRTTASEPEPRCSRLVRALRVPGEASIESSSAPCIPPAAFSAADRACSSTSDILCRDRPARARPFGLTHADRRQAPPPQPPRQRRPLHRNQDASRRRSLADVCNQNNPRAQPRTIRSRLDLADLACPARAGPTGLGPHPPHRPPNPDDAGASAPARPLRAARQLPPSIRRVVPSQGPAGKPTGTSRFTRCAPSFALRR